MAVLTENGFDYIQTGFQTVGDGFSSADVSEVEITLPTHSTSGAYYYDLDIALRLHKRGSFTSTNLQFNCEDSGGNDMGKVWYLPREDFALINRSANRASSRTTSPVSLVAPDINDEDPSLWAYVHMTIRNDNGSPSHIIVNTLAKEFSFGTYFSKMGSIRVVKGDGADDFIRYLTFQPTQSYWHDFNYTLTVSKDSVA
jgi:hypothetical protein